MAKRWYSVSVLSNFEKKIAEQIKTAVAEASLEAEIEEGDSVEQMRNELAELIDRILKEEIESQIKLLTNERR